VTESEHDFVKTNLLIEGLQDYLSVCEVHGAFFNGEANKDVPISDVQRKTLGMIRELLSEELVVAGATSRRDGFIPSELPLAAVMAEIEEAYLGNFEDPWAWRYVFWFVLTEKGEKLALKLYHE